MWVESGTGVIGYVRCVGMCVVWACALCRHVRCVGMCVVWGCALCGNVRCVGMWRCVGMCVLCVVWVEGKQTEITALAAVAASVGGTRHAQVHSQPPPLTVAA